MTEENEEDRLRHTSNNHFDNNFYSAMVAYIILVRFELYLSLNYGIFFILRLSLFIFFYRFLELLLVASLLLWHLRVYTAVARNFLFLYFQ